MADRERNLEDRVRAGAGHMSIRDTSNVGRYDVVVIGAGIAGLLTAALLLRSGHSVLILERDDIVGGQRRSWSADGYTIENTSTFNKRLWEVLAELEIDIDVQPTGGWRVFYPGTKELRSVPAADLWSEPEALSDVLLTTPDRARLLAEVCAQLAGLADDDVRRLITVPISEWIPWATWVKVRGPLRAILQMNAIGTSAGNADLASTGELARFLRLNVGAKNRYPSGGMGSIVSKLAERVRALGGEIRLESKVTELIVHRRAARGVAFVDTSGAGRVAEASHVVCTPAIWDALEFLDRAHFSTRFVSDAEALGRLRGHATRVAFGMSGLPTRGQDGDADTYTGITRIIDVVDGEPEFGGIMSIPTLSSPGLAPSGKQLLLATRVSPRAEYANWVDVMEVAGGFEDVLQRCYTNFTDVCVWRDVFPYLSGIPMPMTTVPMPGVEGSGISRLYFAGYAVSGGRAMACDLEAESSYRAAEVIDDALRR